MELAYCKNIALPLPRQDAQGVPIFENHLAWSISHTDNFLAVSISQHGSIGIDIERIKPRDIVCFDLFDDTEYQFSGNILSYVDYQRVCDQVGTIMT